MRPQIKRTNLLVALAALGVVGMASSTALADAGPSCKCEAPGHETRGLGWTVGLGVPALVLGISLVRHRRGRHEDNG